MSIQINPGIRRGATYGCTFQPPEAPSEYSAILVTFVQGQQIIHSFTEESPELAVGSTDIVITLSQQQTLAFAPSHFSPMGRETKGFVYVQCRCFKSASVVTESQNIPIPVEVCESEEVLS